MKDPGEAGTSRGVTNPNVSEVDVDESTSKTCSKCNEAKSLDDFYKPGAVCKECRCARMRERYAADPESKLARNRRWRLENMDRVRELERERYARNPEYYREKRRLEIESGRRAELVRDWRARNNERANENARAWRAANRERLRELGRQQYAANPSKFIERGARRRAVIAGVESEAVDLDLLWTGACGICGEPMSRDLPYPHPDSPSIDHIVPISKGGAHRRDNLQWAHLFCNVSKGDRLPN